MRRYAAISLLCLTPSLLMGSWALLMGGCAASPPPRVQHAAPVPIELTEARSLLALLPAGADGCVVAWPGRLSERQRRWVARLSAAKGFPFVVPEHPRVYVEAWRARPDGGVSRVMLWSFGGSAERLRHFVLTRAPLVSRFEHGDDSRPSYTARFVREDRLGLSRGSWPAGVEAGAESECAEQLADAVGRDAIELSIERRGSADVFARLRPSERDLSFARTGSRRWLLPAHRGVRVVRRERYLESSARDLALSEDAQRPRDLLDEVLGLPESRASGPSSLTRTRRVSYADLALLAEDDADQSRVVLLAQRAQSPLPVARVDVSDLDALERQLGLRRIQLEVSSPTERDVRRRELLELLRRGYVAQPTEPRIVLPFVRLALELDQDADASLAALMALTSAGSVDPRELTPLRHEALSYRSEHALAEALRVDASLTREAAARAAHALVEVRRSGRAYEPAEGLWLAQYELRSRRLRASGRAPRGVSWPLGSLAETMAALVDQGGVERPLYVVARAADLRGDAGNLPEALGPHATLHFSEGNEGVWVLGATTRGDFALARFGALIESRVRAGPLDLLVAIVPFGADAAEPAAWLHVSGHVEGGRFEIVRMGMAGAPRVNFRSVASLLADPLASAGTQVFPPPRLDLITRDAEQSASIVDALDAVADCQPRPGGLVCRPRANQKSLSRALAALCRARPR